MANTFTIQLRVKKAQEAGGTVHFKSDGSRFTTDKTIKLNTGTDYLLELETRPNKALQAVLVRDRTYSLVKSDTLDTDRVTYTAQWKTDDFDVSKNGKRTQLPITVKFQTGITAMLTLQSKFYGEGDKTHCCWGNPLHYIDFDCKVLPGSTTVEIVKETFR